MKNENMENLMNREKGEDRRLLMPKKYEGENKRNPGSLPKGSEVTFSMGSDISNGQLRFQMVSKQKRYYACNSWVHCTF
eukprot:Nk52_evm30s2039 gene=Nk52_evmTU30s2039